VACGPEWQVSRAEGFPEIRRLTEFLIPANWPASAEVPGCLYLHRVPERTRGSDESSDSD
jgi:hypothetical protein